MAPLVISAKNLGAFAIEGACRRCLWVQLHVKNLPYQIFPGIFSSIDAYNKRVVHGYFDREGCMPSWLGALGDVVGYVEPPSYHKFTFDDQGEGHSISRAVRPAGRWGEAAELHQVRRRPVSIQGAAHHPVELGLGEYHERGCGQVEDFA